MHSVLEFDQFFLCTDPGVRDSSAEALGTAMKVVGEKVIMPFLPDLEAMKMTKIKECCEKAVISGKPAAGAAKPKAAPAAAEVKEAAKPAEAPKRPGAVIKKPTPAASSTGSGPPKKPAGKAVVKKPAAGAKPEEKIEKELSPEDVEEKAAALLPPDVITGITDANWKTRLGAMESLMQVISVLLFTNFLKTFSTRFFFLIVVPLRRSKLWREQTYQHRFWLGPCARNQA